MGNNPVNLALRFVLEITALVIAGYWGFYFHEGFMGYLVGIGTPLLMGTVWGVFAVANDPSRSGKTVIPTPGWVRLFIELTYFGFASYALYTTENKLCACFFASITIIHYLISYDRVKWLMTQK